MSMVLLPLYLNAVVPNIDLFLQHSDPGVKVYPHNCPLEGAGVGFITTLTMHGGLSMDA